MAIYRGPGGSGDAVNDAASEVLLALTAKDAAVAAQVAAEAAQTAAETAETNAETSETNAAASAALAATYTPSQTGNSGKYLKTNGTTTSWDAIEINTADITGTLPIANGGTNATTQANARTNLGVTATGADTTYAYRANNLSDLASASTARTNLGLGTIATQAANNVSITGGSVSGITDLAIADGGTGASDAPTARTNLGLGTISTQAANNVSITGGSINNSAIGGTTANSGAFTTLSASGVATISAGTVSAPALTTTGDTNTGIFFPAADTIAFTEGGVESMRIDSSGNVGIGITPTSRNNTRLQIVDGIGFPATQVASSDANTLDDYEEGTWTGTIKGATTDPTTPVTATGSYTKIGRQVFARIHYSAITTTGASGNFYVSGLPFTPSDSDATGNVMTYDLATFAGSNLSPYISGTSVFFYYMSSNGAWNPATHNAGANRYLIVSVTYQV